jgi:hypothetical protein
LESRLRYGVIGAGSVSGSLIGRLPARVREFGPVAAVSYRVASRIANTLGAGYPARKAEELNKVSSVLIHSSAVQMERLIRVLEAADINWKGKALVFCDCSVDREIREYFQTKGASIALVREFCIPGHLIVEAGWGIADGEIDGANNVASRTVHRIARDLRLKTIEISPGSADLFDAAQTLGTAAITPLIHNAASLFRDAGVRDSEAARIASALFEQTARDYAHSGKQSWVWYLRKPQATRLDAQIAAADPHLHRVLEHLLRFGFETFHKHREIGASLTASLGDTDKT